MIRIITGSRVQRHRAGVVLIGALLLVLALALTACSAGTGSSGTTTQGNNSTSNANGGSSTTAQQLQHADQQVQNVVQTMNNAANDAQYSDSTTGGDSNQQP